MRTGAWRGTRASGRSCSRCSAAPRAGLARAGVRFYASCMHILASVSAARPPALDLRPGRSASHIVRLATPADVPAITALVTRFADQGLMLPRTGGQIALAID